MQASFKHLALSTAILLLITTPILANPAIKPAVPDTSTTMAQYDCSDGDLVCANGHTAVAYCDGNNWWVREICGNVYMCNQEPYPICVPRDEAPFKKD
jgi:hypothetical protein